MEYTDRFTFLENATTATTGEEMPNTNNTILVVSVEGTFSGAITFEGFLGNVWHPLAAVSLGDLGLVYTVTEEGAYTVASPVGFDKIRANLKTISSGSVTVIGRVYGGESVVR